MTTTFKAKFDRGVLIPEQPLDLREGEVIELEVKNGARAKPSTRPAEDRPLMRLLDAVRDLPSDPHAPPDGAAQHDHYLYGTPKRSDP